MNTRLLSLLLIVVLAQASFAGQARPTDSEQSAMDACRSILQSEETYRLTDYDENGALEYAQTLGGLYETAAGKADVILLDETVVKADATRAKPEPRRGYLFKILKSQGEKAAKGKLDYVKDGKMTQGIAVIAYPAKYGKLTRYTYLLGTDGTIHQKDLGDTADAAGIKEFNPDDSWSVFAEEPHIMGNPNAPRAGQGDDETPAAKALAEMMLNPHDPYLQYVAMQLGQREGRVEDVAAQIDRFNMDPRTGRREGVDLMNLFSGAMAVQECLQLDTMRARNAAPAAPEARTIDVATLKSPEVKSHPWKEMLKGQKPQVSALCKLAPEDFYLVEFRSLNNLIDAMETSNLWGTHLFSQAAQDARTPDTGARLKRQLAIESNPALRPIYDMVVEEVAVVGSDLYLHEGSDVTVLFKMKQPEIFKLRMNEFLDSAEKGWPSAKRDKGTYMDVAYEQVTTPDREVSVYSAYPLPDVHVRSNSLAALRRVIESVKGTDAAGKAVKRLGDSDEFAYVRTLMPRGDSVEDGFVYLSDPFIRNLVGARTKLTEKHRMVCYNHLRIINHAAMLYRTEKGKAAANLAEISDAQCSPGVFNQQLICPDGGTYSLSADGSFGACSCHGHAHYLVPCCEVPVTKVSAAEAEEYKQFVEAYSQYWRMYFDPIALRLQITPQRYRIETLILPLIDNSIYTQLAMVLGGNTVALDSAPVPKSNIMSVSFKINKQLMEHVDIDGFRMRDLDVNQQKLAVSDFVRKGIGDNIALHVCDAVPTFDFSLLRFMGEMMGSLGWRGPRGEALYATLLVTALNAPVYVSVPVQDAKIVDDFLDAADRVLAIQTRQKPTQGWLPIDLDFYKLQAAPKDGPPAQNNIHAYGFRFGPVKWRFFWARIGGFLYVASQQGILEELAALDAAPRPPVDGVKAAEPNAHALLKIRPANWNLVLPDYNLGWAENNREACLNNQSMLASVAKAYRTELAAKPDDAGKVLLKQANRLHAAHFFCPDGGSYAVDKDSNGVTCSAHGSVLSPKQANTPNAATPSNTLMRKLSAVTVSLTLLEDGLRAVLTVDRK